MHSVKKFFIGSFIVLLSSLAYVQMSFAQAPLSFGDNFFVTGDYIVAGAGGMTTNFANGYAVGTFTIPDTNPGIHGRTSVPPGAEVIGAFVYWQTVENVGTVPGQAGTGENGFFRPLITNGPPAPGYPITGLSLPGENAVSWSQGGCSQPSTSKITRTYRADVLGAFPQDAKGNVLTNGKFEIRLPSVGPQTPLTLGATLIIIYRVLSPNVPLNSIVIYDGAFGQSDASLNMMQTVQGFYDADHNPVSKLTLITGAGKSNKSQVVSFGSSSPHGGNTMVQLPSHSGHNLPPFPGYYGSWDNDTWTFGDPNYPEIANPVLEDANQATVEVVPSANGPGCVSWGVVVVSTTVKNSSHDGLLDSWKTSNPPGYCDASVAEGQCRHGDPTDPAWVDLPGATLGEQDIFIQLDYMCSDMTGLNTCVTGDGSNYSFDPTPSGAVGLVKNAFLSHSVHVHVNETNPLGSIQPVHAIQEQTCADVTNPQVVLCPFPNQAGVVGWKGGYAYFMNQLVNTSTGTVLDCLNSPTPSYCQPRFQHGRKDSWHYSLFAHAVGRTEWDIQDGSLTSVVQSGNTVTFTTSTPLGTYGNLTYGGYDNHGNPLPDPSCPNGRVSVYYASTNTNLNGTFCINTSTAPGGNTFTIVVPGTSESAHYTLSTDPYLSVAPGQTSTASGVSDVGGSDSLITLGRWGDPTLASSNGQQENTLAGTFMHETGHSLALTHGGFYYDNQLAGSYVPTIEPNCKPNFQSVMNYFFQVDLLNGLPDYSEQQLDPLDEGSLPAGVTYDGGEPLYPNTKWYTPVRPVAGSAVTLHCDGSLPSALEPPTFLVPGSADPTSPAWDRPQSDVNFDGIITSSAPYLRGYDDWASTNNGATTTGGIDLRQVGATGNSAVFSQANFFGGGQALSGSGRALNGGGRALNGGGQALDGSGEGALNGGGRALNGGGRALNGGGRALNGGGEIDQATADSYTRPPTGLTASEEVSPRYIDLSWTAPTFGQIGSYNIYRSSNGGVTFTKIASVNAPQTTYHDQADTCDPTGYQYFVTAVLSNSSTNPGQESVPSNIVAIGAGQNPEPLTGCYALTGGSNALSVTGFASPASNATFTQGDSIAIAYPVTDDFYPTGGAVPATANKTLAVIGPLPSPSHDNSCAALNSVPAYLQNPANYSFAPVTLLSSGGTGITISNSQFTLTWNTTSFSAGCYVLEADFDSGQVDRTEVQITIFESDTTPHILTTTLPTATVGTTYANTIIQESGGTGAITWSIIAGALPPGFTLNAATGTVSGITTASAGNYNFTVQATDSSGNFGTRQFTLPVLIFISDTTPLLPAPYTLTTTLPPATVGTTYNPTNSIQQAGGTGPFTWSITAGALPPGFTLNAATGTVSGITTAPAGNYNFTVQVTDSLRNTSGMIQFTLPVLIFISDTMPALPAPYTLNTSLPAATAGVAYNPNTIQEAGAVGAVTWNISAGAPPPGMSFGSGTLSGTPTTAGNYNFTVQATDSNGSMSGKIQFMVPVLIFVSDSTAPTVTKILAPAPVGSSYNNSLDETGGTGTLSWSVIAGVLPPGLSLGLNSGVVSGTPTAPGNYNFTVQVMDSASPPNVAALAFMLSVPDAQYGDLIVVDGASTASPLGGTLFRITPTGAAGTIAAISNGSPTGVAVDSSTGNIYVAANSVSGNGTTRIVKIDPFGVVTDPFIAAFPVVGAVLQNPVALAVDNSGNVYVGDNQANAVYEFNSSGSQVDAGPFVSLPSSNNVLNHIRMTFDSSGNLDVASDSVGGVSGQVEVDQIASNGTLSVLYNTTTKSTAAYSLTAAGNASGGNTSYTGTFSPTLPVGSSVTVTGFTNAGNNSTGEPFTVVSCTSTQLVVNNGAGVAETPASPGTATLQLTQITTVGGITVLPDGSIDLADYGAQAIYNITSPGAANMGITTAISAASASNPPASPLCCNVSGMASPPSVGNSNLYVSLNGADSTTPQLQLAVPQTSSLTAVNSTLTYSLTAAGAVDQNGNTTYTGTFSPTIPAGSIVTIAGFMNAGNNSTGGPFTVVSCTSTQLVVLNGSGVAESNPGTASIATPLTSPNDVAWYSKH